MQQLKNFKTKDTEFTQINKDFVTKNSFMSGGVENPSMMTSGIEGLSD